MRSADTVTASASTLPLMTILFLVLSVVVAPMAITALDAGIAQTVTTTQSTDYHTTITFKGKIQNVITIKAMVNDKEVEINVVNGFVPDEIVEGTEKDKVIFRNFWFGGKSMIYDKTKKYEYTFIRLGPSVTESVRTDGAADEKIVREYFTQHYQLKR